MDEATLPWVQPEAELETERWTEEAESPFQPEADLRAELERAETEGFADGEAWSESEGATCTPAVGTGTRPLLVRTAASERTRVNAVGYAQQLLNNWLSGIRAGTSTCTDRSSGTVQYIVALHQQLRANRSDPLVVDCLFGGNTETATKMFQACHRLVRDGKIGQLTWPALERFATPGPSPAPPPAPEPQPTPPPSGVRERRDVWVLSTADVWHPTILWYARGVAALRARDTDVADPTCWRHLAETHGASNPNSSTWPRGARWNSCEHGSWFFLPWHRVYLHHFEKIMRAAIASLGGPQDWALPYWNYSDASRPEVRSLPPAFRQRTMPDGRDNPLFVNERGPGMNDRGSLSAGDVSTTAALAHATFSEAQVPAFGGRAVTTPTHNGSGRGALELVPHGSVHGGVGGDTGWMSSFDTAGLDPIFWLHHANVDRIWEAWLRQRSRQNPTDQRWLSARFDFGAGSTTTSLTSAQVIDTTRTPLGYRYSDMPLGGARETFEELFDEGLEPSAAAEDPRPLELVGATSGPVSLGTRPSTATVDVSAPVGPRAREAAEAAPPANARVFLKLENITGTKLGATSFEVHVNVPEGAKASDFADRRAGLVPMFGVVEASQRTDTHSGSGVDAMFDITRIVRALSAAGAWDPKRMRVTITPLPNAVGGIPDTDVKVGRVSLFYA